ncbi:hypothetical protein [Turneriella parva]|uniref:DUF3575 domain-containing protein n=1 Tax=Turneriella parva (strain ATCC BAA-1111 / DSM 21527 / NCTC 11395 / H) TaxID=869212 RepID=I4B2Z4_TURPD|nr:hypothetical protein [Turneriella parva]AFM11651.1 hypothetical protein Turpa_1002 [Turneriella parva DSM 21527]
MKKTISMAALLALLALSGAGSISAQKAAAASATVQNEPPAAEPFNRYFIGSSLFMVMNAVASPSPDFYQLNFGYWLTKKDVLSVEAITWTYHRALGTPWGPDMSDDAQRYPGYVRAYGVGIAYQRYLWQGLYAAVHALPLLQQFKAPDGKTLQEGFQLFMTLRLGYHFSFCDDHVFIEPSIAVTHWPINTNVPADFARLDSRWPSYFIEPGLHVGFKF